MVNHCLVTCLVSRLYNADVGYMNYVRIYILVSGDEGPVEQAQNGHTSFGKYKVRTISSEVRLK